MATPAAAFALIAFEKQCPATPYVADAVCLVLQATAACRRCLNADLCCGKKDNSVEGTAERIEWRQPHFPRLVRLGRVPADEVCSIENFRSAPASEFHGFFALSYSVNESKAPI